MTTYEQEIIALGNLPLKVELAFKKQFPNYIVYDLENSMQNLTDILTRHSQCQILITFLCHKITKTQLELMPKLKVIANYAVGFDNIDIEEASRCNIIVLNTPDVLSEATADLAFALLMSCSRHIVTGHNYILRNHWQGLTINMFLGQSLSHKTVGIIGFGRIGQIFAKRLLGFDVKILYTKFSPPSSKDLELEHKYHAKRVELDELLKASDVISVHCPLNDSTYHLIDESKFRLMKPNCIFINTARGSVVDEKALIAALINKNIQAAGLDVFEFEPNLPQSLKTLDNVVLTPHIGSADEQTREAMGYLLLNGITSVLNKQRPDNIVNNNLWNKFLMNVN